MAYIIKAHHRSSWIGVLFLSSYCFAVQASSNFLLIETSSEENSLTTEIVIIEMQLMENWMSGFF